jgi:hypothetical protein
MGHDANETADPVHEVINEKVVEPPDKPGWFQTAAIFTMVMAFLASVSGLLAGISANSMVEERLRLIEHQEQLEEHLIAYSLLCMKRELLSVNGNIVDADKGDINNTDSDKLRKHLERVNHKRLKIKEDDVYAGKANYAHHFFAIGVTVLSLAITFNGIALASREKKFTYIGVSIGLIGLILVVSGTWVWWNPMNRVADMDLIVQEAFMPQDDICSASESAFEWH